MKRFTLQKTLLAILLLPAVMCGVNVQAQFSNDWVRYGRDYIKIPVAEEGIYALDYNFLSGAGASFSDPIRAELWHRGAQHAMKFEDANSNGVFDQGDRYLFYGKGNDGYYDSFLHDTPGSQANTYYNLFSDTTFYYFTWTESFAGLQIEEVNTTFSRPLETHHQAEYLNNFNGAYHWGGNHENTALNSRWTSGEGWGGGGSSLHILTVENIINTFSGAGTLEISLLGTNIRPHNVEVAIGSAGSALWTVLGVINFNGYTNSKATFPIPDGWQSYLDAGKLNIRLTDNGTGGAQITPSYCKLTLPQILNMSSQALKVFLLNKTPDFNGAKIEINNTPSDLVLFDITDERLPRNIKVNYVAGNRIQAFVTLSRDVNRRLIAANRQELKTPLYGTKIRFRKYLSTDTTFLIITHPALRVPVEGVGDAVAAYANYRQSLEGGGYTPLIADIIELYDQFTSGEETPLAIRRFMEYLIQSPASKKPAYLFIIGKGTDASFEFLGSNIRTTPRSQIKIKNLVPPGGHPGSDVLFTDGLAGYPANVNSVPTGRLSAHTPQDIVSYLQKVKEHESLPYDGLWRKSFLHMGGGNNAGEIKQFSNYLRVMGAQTQGPPTGGIMQYAGKTTDATIQLFDISKELNEGLGLVHMFGHSDWRYTDVDIGYCSDVIRDYNNTSKYPLIYISGCSSGNVFYYNDDKPPIYFTFGEDWINTPRRGAIAYMANTHLGFTSPLNRYGNIFYTHSFQDSATFGLPLGKIMQLSVAKFLDGSGSNMLSVAHAQQMILLGDPALKIFAPAKPDYAVNKSQFFLTPIDGNPLTVASDSFRVSFVVTNFGRVPKDTVVAQLTRSFLNRKIDYPLIQITPVKNADTITLTIPNIGLDAFGANTFTLEVDAGNFMDELSEQNNSLTFTYNFPSNFIRCLLPKKYSVVSTQPVRFTAQAGAGLTDEKVIQYEVDTSYTFTSTFKRSGELTAKSLYSWSLNLLPVSPGNDSVVYYWRTRYKQMEDGQPSDWDQSSFIYINNSPTGWSQSKFPQFYENNIPGMVFNKTAGKFDYQTKSLNIEAASGGSELNAEGNFISAGGNLLFSRICAWGGANGLYSVRFDRKDLATYATPNIDPGYFCHPQPQVSKFLYSELGIDYLKSYIDNVQTGDYLLFTSVLPGDYSYYGPEVAQRFSDLGATKFSLLKEKWPYILLVQKGKGVIKEMIPDSSSTNPLPTNQLLRFDTIINTESGSGEMLSTTIGPATEWGTLFYDFKEQPASHETAQINVWGIRANGTSQKLIEGASNALPLAAIDAGEFPYLRLQAVLNDTIDLTPPALRKWQVIYSGVPEGILLTDAYAPEYSKINGKEIQEGTEKPLIFEFKNISEKAFKDSLIVQITTANTATGKAEIKYDTLFHSLKPDSSWKIDYTFSTANRAGKNSLSVFFNPEIQPEEYYDNNLLNFEYTVVADKTNPVLDVAFDGVRIMNGDIVSATPVISIVLNDENKSLIRSDTVGIRLFLGNCTENENCLRQIYFTDPAITYVPAGKDNRFEIQYRPQNLTDGTYRLRVDGADVTGNKAGNRPYQVDFQVINKSMVSNFFPYPNPFSTKLRFAYTLTGSVVPQQVKIQIMTVTGKVIREITQNELGPLKIGTHLTDYAWDGRDEFGDKLANGVYFYRVLMRIDGKDPEKFSGNMPRSSNYDEISGRAFKNDFGKIYLLR